MRLSRTRGFQARRDRRLIHTFLASNLELTPLFTSYTLSVYIVHKDGHGRVRRFGRYQ